MERKIHNFDEMINRVNTDSWKWDYEGEGGKYIPLGVADTDFRAPEEIIQVLRNKVDFGIYAYGYLPQQRFAGAVCSWYQERYGLTVETDWIRHSQGLMTGALWMLLHAYTRPGDKILLQPPVYSTFRVVIEGSGRFVETNNLVLENGRYEIDFEDLAVKVSDPRVRILLVCNPHNPVGRVWTREELTKMYGICKEHGVLIISDEIHGDLVYGDHKHIPFFSISDDAKDHVIVMSGPSKTFNLACFYTTYVVIKNKQLLEQYEVVYSDYHFDYNYLGMETLITAYNECSYYADQEREYLWKNILFVKEYIKTHMPEVKITEPEATYLLWIDFSAWNLSQCELMHFFTDCGVRLNNGAGYGENGNGFVRMNIACPREVLTRALHAINEGYIKMG